MMFEGNCYYMVALVTGTSTPAPPPSVNMGGVIPSYFTFSSTFSFEDLSSAFSFSTSPS
jgi:hypothetical protein